MFLSKYTRQKLMVKRIKSIIIMSIIATLLMPIHTFGAKKEVVAKASVVSGGDLLISQKIIDNSKVNDDIYDFNYIFKYIDDYIREADYAVINLETSIGKDKNYCGFPRFNTPEYIVPAAKDAGFDMFLTASNHSYDLGYDAVNHRLSVLDNYNVDSIGTRSSTSKSFHKVVNVNGIKIGMLNYTQECLNSTKSRVVLNRTSTGPNGTYEDVVVDSKGMELISSYNRKDLTTFYKKLEGDITDLKEQGAEIIVAYPHWGTEYNIGYNETQDKIAQKMCDLGIDVIVGGHPHVVEPTKVYTSKVSGKTTICLFSTGNFVSNMVADPEVKNGLYKRDGALFEFVVKKYSDETVAVTSANVLPLYVSEEAGKKYTVVPLDLKTNWNDFGIDKYSTKTIGYKSYHRTKNLVASGIKKFNNMPKITKQPIKASVNSGKEATYLVKTVGNKITYQWQHSYDSGKTWKNSIAKGSKTSKITVAGKKKYSGVYYRCKVKNRYGTVYSKKVKLTVY